MSELVVAGPSAVPGGLITEDTQIEWRGVLMGSGSFFGYKRLTGWEDMAGLSSSSSPKPRSHGENPGTLLMNDKIVSFETQMYAGKNLFPEQLRIFRQCTTVKDEEEPLIIRQHGETLLAYARVTGRAMPINREYFQGFPTAVIQWTLSDPRRYSLNEHVAELAGKTGVGGLDWDGGLPWGDGLDWGTMETVGGSPVALNAGTTATSPLIEFIGPLTGPFYLSCASFRLGYNLNIPNGGILIVDTRTGEATLDGVDRLYAIQPDSDIPEDCLIPPGETTFQLDSADPSQTGSVRVTWRDAQD